MQQRRSFWLNQFEKETPKVTWFNYVNLMKKNILEFVEFGLRMNLVTTQERTIYRELGPVDDLNKGIMIYDNTTTFSEHIDNLNENINVLYPQYLASEPKNKRYGFSGLLLSGDYSYWAILSFEGSAEYLGVRLFASDELVESFAELMNYQKDEVQKLYQTKDVEESLESKAIRLKIIETLLAQKIVENDKIQKNEIINIIKSPELLK